MEKEEDAMKKHEPCPVCGEANVEVKEGDIRGEHKFRAVCGKCGWSGPAYDNQNDALLRWDDIAKQIRRHADSKRWHEPKRTLSTQTTTSTSAAMEASPES